jgi:hypothetical protein
MIDDGAQGMRAWDKEKELLLFCLNKINLAGLSKP